MVFMSVNIVDVGKYTSPMDDMGEEYPRTWILGYVDGPMVIVFVP